MKNFLKSVVLLCAAVPLAGSAPAETIAVAGKTNEAAPAKPLPRIEDLFTNEVVARGKGISITQSQLDKEVQRTRTSLAAQGRALPEDTTLVEREILDRLISKELLMAKATEADKAAGRKQFLENLQQFKSRGKLSDEEFDQRLNQQLILLGMTRGEWEQQNAEKNVLPLIVERELNVKISDAEAKKYYDENTAHFEYPEALRAAHILLTTRDLTTNTELPEDKKAEKKKQMEDLLKRARAGEDFAELARQYSEDPDSKPRGGEYTFARGRMVPEFESAAFSLNTNQISDIVTTTYGYHIIKLYEKIPARKEPYAGPDTKTVMPKPDGEQATIREILMNRHVMEELPEHLEKLKKDASVEILSARLKAVELPDQARPGGAGATAGGSSTNGVKSGSAGATNTTAPKTTPPPKK